MLCGNATTVFVLGCNLRVSAGLTSDLNSNFTPLRLHGLMTTGEDATILAAAANAQRAALAENHIAQLRLVLRLGQYRQQRARARFLHLYCGGEHVQSSLRK